MEHFYKNIEGWFTFPNFYTNLINQSKDGYHIIEVGTWKGKSAAYLGTEIINSGKRIKFDCIDTWQGSAEHLNINSPFYEPLLQTKDGLYNLFLKNIEPIKDYVNVVRLPSTEASKLYQDKSLNCVFIDASHEYEDVCNDILCWLPKIKIGGLLAGHDYIHPPIKKALSDTLNKGFFDLGEDVWGFKIAK